MEILRSAVPDLTISQFLGNRYVRLKSLISARIRSLEFQYGCRESDLSDTQEFRYRNELRALNLLLARLDINCIVLPDYEDLWRAWRRFPDTCEDHSRILFGSWIPRKAGQRPPIVVQYFRSLTASQVGQRVSEHRFRLLQEIGDTVDANGFVVFNTLTVEDRHYEEFVEKGSLLWSRYVRSVRNFLDGGLCGENGSSYFAVSEQGSLRGRLHIHVLHFFSRLPADCSDPNYGRKVARYREIDALKRFWPYGFSSPVAVRFGPNDGFGRAGWRWPVEQIKSKYVPIRVSSPISVGSYLLKYVLKAYTDGEDYKWRTKMNRNFGLLRLNRILGSLTNPQLELVMSLDRNKRLEMRGMLVPTRFLKKSASDCYMKRRWTELTVRRFLLGLKPALTCAERIMILTRKKQICRKQRSGDSRMESLRRMAASEVLEVFEAFEDEVKDGVGMVRGVPYGGWK